MNQIVLRSKEVVFGMSNAAMLQAAFGQNLPRPYARARKESVLPGPEPLLLLEGLDGGLRTACTFATPLGAHLDERSLDWLAEGVAFGLLGWMFGAETPTFSRVLDLFYTTRKTDGHSGWGLHNLLLKESRRSSKLQEALNKAAARFVEADEFGYPAMVTDQGGANRVVWLDSYPGGMALHDVSAWLDAGSGRFTLTSVATWMESEAPVSRPVSCFPLTVLYRELHPKRVTYLDGHYALTEGLDARARLGRRTSMMALMYGRGMSGDYPH